MLSCCEVSDQHPDFKYTIEINYIDNSVDTITVISKIEPKLNHGYEGTPPYVYSIKNGDQNYRVNATYVKNMKILSKSEFTENSNTENYK
jgi:hypothetical protein